MAYAQWQPVCRCHCSQCSIAESVESMASGRAPLEALNWPASALLAGAPKSVFYSKKRLKRVVDSTVN